MRGIYRIVIVTLIGQHVMAQAGRRNQPLLRWLNEGARIAEEAGWRSLADVHTVYPSTDGVKLASRNVVTVFNPALLATAAASGSWQHSAEPNLCLIRATDDTASWE